MQVKSNDVNDASRFLANTLHEIRTPIQTIIGTVELISETHLDKEQTEYIRQIQFSAEVLLDLANNILDFTKIRSNQFKLESVPFDIAQVTEQVVDLICIEAFNKGVEVVVDIAQDMPEFVIGDSVRIQQIMLNLIKNAVKFTNSGYIHVELSYTKDKKVHFQITDTGIGINKEKQKKLFTDYFQADISTYRKYGGTGLGLSICKNLVTVMKGEIGVKSNPYGGSIFYFTIPLAVAHDEEYDIPLSCIKNTKIPFYPQMHILIVDENILAAKSLISKLRKYGVTDVDIAITPDNAISMIEFAQKIDNPYSSIFVNMKLSSMDGWHFASEVKNKKDIKKNFKMYLLVPEGQMRREAKMKLLNWFDDYLYKPVKRCKLAEILEQAEEIGCKLIENLDVEEIDITPFNNEILPTKEETPKSTNSIDESELIAKGLKILVAEDHPVNRKLIETFLKKLGADIYIAEDGEEVLERIKEFPDIAMIFMDIFMPRKSGVEATEILRNQGYKGIIIACTANNDSNDFNDYMKIGMEDILVKPFKKDAIKERILKWNTVMRFPEKLEKIRSAKIQKTKTPEEYIWNHVEYFKSINNSFEFGKNLIDDFILQTEDLIKQIDKNLKNELETNQIHILAHAIKGSASHVYANALYDAATDIDEKAKKSKSVLETAKIETTELHKVFEIFKSHSKNILNKINDK